MQCCHNSNNDKLALLDTIYNQTFKHFTHLIYIYNIFYFLILNYNKIYMNVIINVMNVM